MDLLDGPDDADTIEMDRPPRPWERYADKWRLRWRESGPVTRGAITAVAVLVAVGGAGIAYTATRSAAPRTTRGAVVGPGGAGLVTTVPLKVAGSGYPATQVQWVNGPHGKPWAVVSTGSAVAASGAQAGTVTAVSPESLTVTSPGGATVTYAVTAATQVNFHGDAMGSIRDGETVDVIAARAGETSVALLIESLSGTPAARITGP